MLASGNSKLGHLLHSFSIPARDTCPGATSACLAVCYAKRGHFRWGSTKQSHQRNWQRSLRNDFVAEIVAEVAAKRVKILRIHSAGDMYSAKYIRKWIEIARQCPGTVFFTYSRSWRMPKLRRALREFSQLPNVRLWLSADRDSGRPPKWRRTRVAYMLDQPHENVPEYANLVFRVKDRQSVRKFINGKLCCPAENGISQIGCSQCQLCFKTGPIPQKLLQFS